MARYGKRWMIGIAVVAAIAAASAGSIKLIATPEWRSWTGDHAARVAACRELWKKPKWRAVHGLRRLLSDPDPRVRLAAIEASTRRKLRELLPDIAQRATGDADTAVSDRAYQALLEMSPMPAEWLGEVEAVLRQEPGRRLALAADYARVALAADRADHDWLLDMGMTEANPALRGTLVRHAQAYANRREELIAALETPSAGLEQRAFILAMLAGIDGVMRGYAAPDWRQIEELTAVEPAPPVDGFVVEAEWAFDLQPNFQIEAWQGERALVLHEGAGGFMSWLGREDSTVDIGRGRLPFHLAKAGTYHLWARVWMDNKCGNSTGMRIDGTDLGDFSDGTDLFGQWVWMEHGQQRLREGPHVLELRALEDGVQVDKYALLPPGETPGQKLERLNALYDEASLSSIGFTSEMQHQLRGTTQPVTVWVRRHSPSVKGGSLRLTVPEPFETVGGEMAEVRFGADEPLARATFHIRLPEDAIAGEVTLTAVLQAEGRTIATGSFLLGPQLDWWTTGRMAIDDPRATRLMAARKVDRDTVLREWRQFPAAGYDRYRRLDLEAAFGQSQDCITFLYTELEIGEKGTYRSYLTMDDTGSVCIDGRTIASVDQGGPAEGRMVVRTCTLAPGRVGVLAWTLQADFADPEGDDADRHSYNNWIFKWLLREERHRPATQIRGVPLAAEAATVSASQSAE